MSSASSVGFSSYRLHFLMQKNLSTGYNDLVKKEEMLRRRTSHLKAEQVNKWPWNQ